MHRHIKSIIQRFKFECGSTGKLLAVADRMTSVMMLREVETKPHDPKTNQDREITKSGTRLGSDSIV